MNVLLADPPVSTSAERSLGLLRALSAAPPQTPALLQAALGPLCSGAKVAFGLLLALDEERVLSAAVCEGRDAVDVEPELLERLVTQGIAGYAAAREAPVLLRDITADPRWAPPSLDQALPTQGAALAVPTGSPTRAVLVLVTDDPRAFTGESAAWLEQGMQLLGAFLDTALELDSLRASLSRMQARDLLRRDLSAMALHDMRTPLQNIQLAFTAASRLMAASLDPDRASRAHDLIQLGQRSAAHLDGLSTTLLDIARLEDDSVAIVRQPAALDALIHGALDATAVMAESSGCALTVDVDPHLPELLLDVSLIRRVLINLIENALKHTPPGGRIWINAVPFAQGAMVRVADTGPGVPPELQEEIFTKYFQIRPAEGKPARGVGLGLAFCRLAVTAHRGEIWAENRPEGGSVFAFTLPAQA